MADISFDDVINFVEVNPLNADKHLTQLWAVMADIKHPSKSSDGQFL